ncbi:MAG: DUF1501 domain-containing protein [Myxococcales bacterium]|nr:DUF1501 domain-containing protein [Myxococcales bacterium]
MDWLTSSRREFLLASAGLLGAPSAAFARTAGGEPKHLLVIFAEGGWDVTYCLDPKLGCGDCSIVGPEADLDPKKGADPDDREAIRTFGDLPIVVNEFKRPGVARFFERWHDQCHVVNGVWTGSIAHDPCRYRVLTGTASGRSPDLVSIAGFTHGQDLPLGSVDLSGWGIAGPLASSSGRIGAQAQISSLLDDQRGFRAPQAGRPYPIFRAGAEDDVAIEAYLAKRADAMRRRFSDQSHNDAAIADLERSVERAARFRNEAAPILDSLDIGDDARFVEQLRIAFELMGSGMCHSVTVDTRNDWDTHDINFLQHRYYDDLFSTLDLMLEQLQTSPLRGKLVIAVLSEMTRTPLPNKSGGKDHWGHTSALLLGGVRGNAVSGGTDRLLESLPADLTTGRLLDPADCPSGSRCLIKYDNLAAGILDLVGVDPEPWLPGVLPFRAAHPS